MERLNAQNGNVRRLVLGFDAGCTTCSGLAKRLEEAVGGELEVRSLTDPMMACWRATALGDDAPWAPTLVEVDGGVVRAWTGVRMGAHLARRLGPVATWRAAKILGQTKEDGGTGRSPYDGFSHSQFLKGVGGAVVGMSMLSGTSMLSSSAIAREPQAFKSVNRRNLGGQELGRIAQNAANRVDITNVMGFSWSRKVRASRIAKARVNGQDIEVLSDHGDPSVRADDGGVSVSGGGVVVRAARHTLKDGNGLLAVAYVAENRLLVYYEFNEPVDGTKSKAEIWDLDQDNDAVVLRKASRNGALDSQIPSLEGRSLSAARIYCGGCNSSKRRRRVRLCRNVSFRCLVINCGLCIIGLPGYLKLACVYVYCPYLLYCGAGTCCKPGGCAYACAGCPR